MSKAGDPSRQQPTEGGVGESSSLSLEALFSGEAGSRRFCMEVSGSGDGRPVRSSRPAQPALGLSVKRRSFRCGLGRSLSPWGPSPGGPHPLPDPAPRGLWLSTNHFCSRPWGRPRPARPIPTALLRLRLRLWLKGASGWAPGRPGAEQP